MLQYRKNISGGKDAELSSLIPRDNLLHHNPLSLSIHKMLMEVRLLHELSTKPNTVNEHVSVPQQVNLDLEGVGLVSLG